MDFPLFIGFAHNNYFNELGYSLVTVPLNRLQFEVQPQIRKSWDGMENANKKRKQ